jgi:hypothetical protein
MAYADLTFYKTVFLGTAGADADVTRLLARASNNIDQYLMKEVDMSLLGTFQLKSLKLANCNEAEIFLVNGEVYNEFDSISIGTFSMSGKSENIKSSLNSRTKQFLFNAGLLNRSLSCC